MSAPTCLVKVPITENYLYAGETSSTFPYQINLSSFLASNPDFKSAISTASNIAVYDAVSDSLLYRRVKLDLLNNLLAIGFNGDISSVANRTFYVCAGPSISESNSGFAYSSDGNSHKWGLDENTGTSTVDEVGSNDGALVYGAEFQPGIILSGYRPNYGSCNCGYLSDLNGSVEFTVEFILKRNAAGWSIFHNSDVADTNHFAISIVNVGYDIIWMYMKKAGVAAAISFNCSNLIVSDFNHVMLSADLSLAGSGYAVATNCSVNGVNRATNSSIGSCPTSLHTQVVDTYLAYNKPPLGTSNPNIHDEYLVNPTTRRFNNYAISRSNMLLNPSNFWTIGTLIYPIISAFTASPTSGAAPLTVKFTDLSSGSPVLWLWDFGDGSTSTAQNPTHTFQSGRYTVSLKVTNSIAEESILVKNYYIESIASSIGDIYFGFNSNNEPDIEMIGGDVKRDPGFESTVFLSLFTDRRAEESDILPGNQDNKRGYLNDVSFGSKLWLLERETLTIDLLSRSKKYCEEALQWMIDEDIAESIDVSTSITSNKELLIEIKILQDVIGALAFRYYYNWTAQISRRV